jgi:hypothetical protein
MPEGSYTSDELELIARAARDAYAAVSGGEGVPEDLIEITKARLMKALLAAYDSGLRDLHSLVEVAIERIREIDSLPPPSRKEP